MLVPAIRRSVPCNLRRIAACVTYRNKMRTEIARQCNESNLLFTPSPNIAAYRIYSTESDSEPQVSLPMLVDGAKIFKPSVVNLSRNFLAHLTSPYIVELDLFEAINGAKYAITIISKALANRDYDSLNGLVTEDMMKVLRTKIETLSSEQIRLIAVDEKKIFYYTLCDIVITKVADEKHSFEIQMICCYNSAERKELETDLRMFMNFLKFENDLTCNYTFTRNYVNNVGGSWIATFVNHFSSAKHMW